METIDGVLSDIEQLKAELRLLKTIDKIPYKGPVSYSVTWTADTVNPSIGNGTIVAVYTLIGKRCFFHMLLTAGSTTTFGTGLWNFSLPFQVASTGVYYHGIAHIRDSGTNNYERVVQLLSGESIIRGFIRPDDATNYNNLSGTYPFTWATGDAIALSVDYDIA